MVKPFHRRVAFGALKTLGALVPPDSLLEHFTVLGRVLENFRRSSEIAHMVSVNTALTVVGVFLRGAPSGLVHEHVEDEAVLIQIKTLQVVVEIGAIY